jgi:hypothetical protein
VNTFALEIWDDEGCKCTIYSVRFVDGEANELDKFLEKYENKAAYFNDLNKLNTLILEQIADKYGAINEFFNRPENFGFCIAS